MYINQKWDYPSMERCAKKLDELCEASNRNKKAMDEAFETLAMGVQAEVGKAFQEAYAEHVTSIQLFAQILSDEAKQIRNNANAMQQADQDIAAQIRSMFR